MKIYEIVADGEGREIVKVTEGDKIWLVAKDISSPRYAEYLRYTEWVEAGNDPDEFWNEVI